MKKVFIVVAVIAATGAMAEASAQQIYTKRCASVISHKHSVPCQHKKQCIGKHNSGHISYDPASKVLTVSLSNGSEDGRIEICPSHSGKTTIMIRPGETIRYTLGNYGRSSCTIIVSSGNTVLYSKNISNR